jgi:hypothetical protein
MQTIYDIRRDNLRRLIGQWGGPTSLSKKLGHSNGSYIAQLAGPIAWMDREQEAGGLHLNDEALSDVVRAVAFEHVLQLSPRHR